jgi:TolB protein
MLPDPTTTTSLPAAFPSEGPLLAFSSDRVWPGHLFLLDPTNGETRQITAGSDMAWASSWSPDGRTLVYVAMDSDGATTLQIVDAAAAWEDPAAATPTIIADLGFAVDHPAWSPDGDRIAFTAWPSGDRSAPEVWMIGSGGGDPAPLLPGIGASEQPAWSLDGTSLAWIERGDGGERFVALRNFSTGEIARHEVPGSAGRPAWSPDERTLAFPATGPGGQDLYLIGVDGSDLRTATEIPGSEWWPCWLDADTIVFASMSGATLHEISRLDVATGEISLLVERSSDDWWPSCRR